MEKNHVEKFAARVFDIADTEDRAGNANKNTAKTFLSASQYIEVMKQFGELSEEWREKQKYAKWKAVDINTALKNGLTPKPGPPVNDEFEADFEQNLTPSSSTSSTDIVEPPKSQQNHINQSNPPDIPSYIPPTFPSYSNPTVPPVNNTSNIPHTNNSKIVSPPTIHTQTNTIPSSSVSPAYSPTAGGFAPSDEARAAAQKYAKFVVSALDYEDIATAVKYLKMSLKQLTGQDY